MRRAIKILGLTLLGITALIAGVSWWVTDAARQVPEFYRVAVESPPIDMEQQSQELQQRFEQLSEEVGQLGQWQATFTSDQINAWLASEVANQFPNVLPTGTEEPRVLLEDGKALVAARYRRGRIDSVISFELQATLTDQPNVIALRVRQLRAGALPIPIQRFADKISAAASKGDLQIGWQQDEDELVALVTIPTEHEQYAQTPVTIESLAVLPGRIFLAGRTGPAAHADWSPVGPVYRLVNLSRHDNSQN